MDWKDAFVRGIIFFLAVLIYSVLAAITRYCMRADKDRSPLMQIFSLLWLGLVWIALSVMIILCIIARAGLL